MPIRWTDTGQASPEPAQVSWEGHVPSVGSGGHGDAPYFRSYHTVHVSGLKVVPWHNQGSRESLKGGGGGASNGSMHTCHRERHRISTCNMRKTVFYGRLAALPGIACYIQASELVCYSCSREKDGLNLGDRRSTWARGTQQDVTLLSLRIRTRPLASFSTQTCSYLCPGACPAYAATGRTRPAGASSTAAPFSPMPTHTPRGQKQQPCTRDQYSSLAQQDWWLESWFVTYQSGFRWVPLPELWNGTSRSAVRAARQSRNPSNHTALALSPAWFCPGHAWRQGLSLTTCFCHTSLRLAGVSGPAVPSLFWPHTTRHFAPAASILMCPRPASVNGVTDGKRPKLGVVLQGHSKGSSVEIKGPFRKSALCVTWDTSFVVAGGIPKPSVHLANSNSWSVSKSSSTSPEKTRGPHIQGECSSQALCDSSAFDMNEGGSWQQVEIFRLITLNNLPAGAVQVVWALRRWPRKSDGNPASATAPVWAAGLGCWKIPDSTFFNLQLTV